MKNCIYYYFVGIVNINNLDPNKVKIDGRSCKSNFIYYIGLTTIKDLWHLKIDSVNPLYLIIDKLNGYIEESNGNKYLKQVPADESEDTLKSMKNRNKIFYLINN